MSKKFSPLIIAAALSVIALACLPAKPATPEVVSVTLAKGLAQDYKPMEETTEFLPTETLYCSVKVSNLSKGAELKAAWFYGEELLNETYYTAEKGGSGYIGFFLEPEGYWPIGKYRVDIYLGDQLAQKAEFSVAPPKEAIPSQVKKVALAKKVDENRRPVETAEVFSISETVHCSVNADLGIYSQLQARWYYENELMEDFTTTFTAEENARDAYVDFYLEPRPALTPGNYRVEIYLDGNLAHTAVFSVVEEEAFPTGIKLYSSESLGFSLLYPSDWEVLEETDRVTFQASPDVLFSVGVVEGVEGELREIAESIAEVLKEDYPDLEVSFSGPYSGPDVEWWEMDMNFTENDREFSSILLLAVESGKAYIVITLAPAEEESHWLNTFAKMIESFKIK